VTDLERQSLNRIRYQEPGSGGLLLVHIASLVCTPAFSTKRSHESLAAGRIGSERCVGPVCRSLTKAVPRGGRREDER
jgi:hypothetical protein